MATPNARQLATALVEGNAEARAQARETLREAPPKVTDAVAKQLVGVLRKGGDQARACADALYDRKGPRFGELAHTKLSLALQRAGTRDPDAGTQHAFVSRGRDGQYWRKLEDSRPPGNPHPVARVLSVTRSWWTWPVFGMALAILIPMIAGGGTGRTVGASVLVGMIAVAIVLDAFRRRCPRCRKLLGADLLSRIRKSPDHPPTSTFRCAHCRCKWSRTQWL